MTARDASLRLIDSLHLQPAADGGAGVIDDRTFTAARLNRTARILAEALGEERTEAELVTVLSGTTGCSREEAAAHVNRFVGELTDLGWLDSGSAGG